MQKVELHTEVKSGNVSPADANTVLPAVRFTSGDAGKVASLFQKYFHVEFKYFWAGWYIGLGNVILLNIYEFDEYLKNKYADYTEDLSLSDFVLIKFGQSAHEFLKRLL